MDSIGTFHADESQGTVDQMVMMALKQAYETRQHSLKMDDGRSSEMQNSLQMEYDDGRSSELLQNRFTSRRSSSGEAQGRPSNHSFNRQMSQPDRNVKSPSTSKRRQNSGVSSAKSVKSIRSFYSHRDSNEDDSSAFAC
jgi:hypothetical protein